MPVHRVVSGLARPALRTVLEALGWALPAASRVHPRLRAQITRSLVFEISTDDGVARHWSFDGPARRMSSAPGRHGGADHALRFTTSARALVALSSPAAVDRIVDDLHRGRARVEGSTVVLLWFHGLVRTVLPLGRTAIAGTPLPEPYLAPDPGANGEERIVREPAVGELDPRWHAAWGARARLGIVRAASGEPMPEP